MKYLFETKRLGFRMFQKSDANDLFQNHSEDELRKWIPNECYADMEETIEAIDFFCTCANNNVLPYVLAIELKETRKLIGDIGLNEVERSTECKSAKKEIGVKKEIEVGFSIGERYQGNGYATEALKEMTAFANKHFKINILQGRVMRGNVSSCKVLEKCNYQFEIEEFDAKDDYYKKGILVYKSAGDLLEKHILERSTFMDSKQEVMRYLAKHYKLKANSFDKEDNVYIESDTELFRMITFGKAMIFLGRSDLIKWAQNNFADALSQDIIDAGNLYKIECKLRENGLQLAGEHLRFLYRGRDSINCPDDVMLKKIDSTEIDEFRLRYPGFINAFNYEKDEIAIAAFVNGNIAAIAGADNYQEPLWQIGIDTVKEYRRRGLAKLVIHELTKEIIKLGKIPYYTTWSANLASMRTALSVGFSPEWIEYFAEKV